MIANVFSVIVSAFYFILWAAVSAGYPALLSGSHFERINDDDELVLVRHPNICVKQLLTG